jgi:hypothetical protein
MVKPWSRLIRRKTIVIGPWQSPAFDHRTLLFSGEALVVGKFDRRPLAFPRLPVTGHAADMPKSTRMSQGGFGEMADLSS